MQKEVRGEERLYVPFYCKSVALEKTLGKHSPFKVRVSTAYAQ